MSSRLRFKKIVTTTLIMGLLMGVLPGSSLNVIAAQQDTTAVTTVEENDTIAGFVERLYTVALGRASEEAGKAYWVEQIETGNCTGGDCGLEFLYSNEFENRNLSIEDFVEILYKTFFDRESEPNGKAFWVGQLKDGTMTRQDVILGFVDSKEWCNVCATYGVRSGALTAKADIASKNAIGFATRLYTCCLNRDPEEDGLNYWALALTNLEQTGAGAAQLFFELPEFINSNTDDTEYITRLYRTFMGREPEDDGMAFWISKLNAGATRRDVMADFAASQEFTDICKKYGIERGEVDMTAPLPEPSKDQPTKAPTTSPAVTSATEPTKAPNATSTTKPTKSPSVTTTNDPTNGPTKAPNATATNAPTSTPSATPTMQPIPAVGSKYKETVFGNGPITLSVTSADSELTTIIESYVAQDPDFASKYTVVVRYNTYGTNDYWQDTVMNLLSNNYLPDIFAVPQNSVPWFTTGDFKSLATPYNVLIPNVDSEIKNSGIAPYSVEAGMDSNGNVIGLGYYSNEGVFMYRRSIAKEVFGSDDPAVIQAAIGSGSGSWDKFLNAAGTLKAKGYSIVSGIGDVYTVVDKQATKAWSDGRKLYIDPEREAFMELAKELVSKGYTNDNIQWSEGWLEDMAGKGDKPVFGFFVPEWMIDPVMLNYVGDTMGDWAICTPPVGYWWGGSWIMAGHNVCNEKQEGVAKLLYYMTLDSTKTGLQYKWANGLLGSKVQTTVPSSKVMAMSECKLDILGGQDAYPVFREAAKNVSGKCVGEGDSQISQYFLDQVNKYAHGQKDKATAIEDFKTMAEDNFGIDAD